MSLTHIAPLTKLGILSTLVLCTTLSCGSNAPGSPFDLTLTTLLAEYPRGTQPILSLSLRLHQDAAQGWTINNKAIGTISVFSITRDGVRVPSTIINTSFLDGTHSIQLAGLQWLAPGGSARIPFALTPDDGDKGWVLTTFDLDPPRLVYTPPHYVYGPTPTPDPRPRIPLRSRVPPTPWAYKYLLSPGVYTLQLQYEYRGPETAEPNVFRGTLRSNMITFKIRE